VKNSDILFESLSYQETFKRHGYNHIDCELAILPQKLETLHA
jgi:hypothetical protein